MKNKKAVSPVIATVLLIVMVVAISSVVFLWFNNLNEEAVTKFGGKNIKLVCEEVQFQANLQLSKLSILNSGNVPIYNIYIKIESDGSHETINFKDDSTGWLSTGLKQGVSYTSGSLSPFDIQNANKVILIPELLGSSSGGDQTHLCDERYGLEITP
jgi:flagellin-like protein